MKKHAIILILFFLVSTSVSFADEYADITARKAPAKTTDELLNIADTPVSVTEGFEAGVVPPSGWSMSVTNAAYTWKLYNNSPHSGSYAADVEYDPALVPQDEWLLSPSGYYSGTLSLWSYGSVYWGRDNFDNYDGQVWIVVNGVGGGDDIYVGKVDDDWQASWVWSQSTFDLDPLLPVGRPVRIGIRYVGADGAQLAIDDITYNYSDSSPLRGIPTLSEWGAILLALVLAGFSVRAIHRRRLA